MRPEMSRGTVLAAAASLLFGLIAMAAPAPAVATPVGTDEPSTIMSVRIAANPKKVGLLAVNANRTPPMLPIRTNDPANSGRCLTVAFTYLRDPRQTPRGPHHEESVCLNGNGNAKVAGYGEWGLTRVEVFASGYQAPLAVKEFRLVDELQYSAKAVDAGRYRIEFVHSVDTPRSWVLSVKRRGHWVKVRRGVSTGGHRAFSVRTRTLCVRMVLLGSDDLFRKRVVTRPWC